jgi:hypothetical protein
MQKRQLSRPGIPARAAKCSAHWLQSKKPATKQALVNILLAFPYYTP